MPRAKAGPSPRLPSTSPVPEAGHTYRRCSEDALHIRLSALLYRCFPLFQSMMQALGTVPILDKVPGYNLYIGGIIALRRPKALANCNITHVVSVIDWKFHDESPLIKDYQHLHISVDDVDEENLIEHFARSNAFIKEGVNHRRAKGSAQPTPTNEWTGAEGGSGVLIHCAMGKSRSSTVLIAYLLWASNRAHAAHPTPDPDSDTVTIPPQPLDFDSALALVRRGRPLCEPNDGFEEQLKLYHQMGCPDNITPHPLYQRWLYRRNVQESLNVNQAPGMDVVRFEDEHEYEDIGDGVAAPTAKTDPGPGKSPMDLKCRKCRRLLAKSSFTVEHKPPQGKAIADCQHIFLHPLSWMKGALEAGELEGRLTCPNEKCGANVGKYSWQGMRCNCGGWETPVFAVARSRVDEAPARQNSAASTVPEGGAFRLPPGMRRAGGGNL